MSDIIAITVFVVIALLIGASIAFGRGSNRCAVKPRIEEG